MKISIIPVVTILCLAFTIPAWGNGLDISSDDISKSSTTISEDFSTALTEQQQSARTDIFVGIAVTLVGCGVVLINETNRRPDRDITRIGIGVVIVGLIYATYSSIKT